MRFWMVCAWVGCGKSGPVAPTSAEVGPLADVTEVQAQGEAGAYSFSVTIRSDELGCERYADWWEVVSADGALLYRRVLGHSHVDEQPFTRSGGPVDIAADAEVWVRAHLAPGGYGGTAFFGSVANGFSAAEPTESWENLATLEPLPTGCAF